MAELGTRISVWPPVNVRDSLARPTADPPFPLGMGGTHTYAKARHGLWHGVRALGLQPGDAILVPAYHQGSEVEAFVKAGLVCEFYSLMPDLTPDQESLDAALRRGVRAFHLIHYWGFPQDTRRWRRWCDDRGLFLIEDGAQAWLARDASGPVGALGDLAVFCAYKSFGLPDGAVARCTVPLEAPLRPGVIGLRSLAGRAWSRVASRNAAAAALEGRFREPGEVLRGEGEFLEGEFELGDPWVGPTRVSDALLARLCRPDAAVRRRHNSAYLREVLGQWMPAGFPPLSEGAVPVAFPVVVDDAGAAVRSLAEERIEVGRFWPTWHPSFIPAESSKPASLYRDRVIGLPVHQELRPSDLERIAGVVKQMLSAT